MRVNQLTFTVLPKLSRSNTLQPESSGVYYSTILLAKALEDISTPPTETGCEAKWSEGGDEARTNLMEVGAADCNALRRIVLLRSRICVNL